VLRSTVPAEANLLLLKRPELVLCVLILCALGGFLWVAALRELWVFIALPAVGMAFYLPLVVNDRYLGGFVLVLFLVWLSAVRFRTEDERVVRIVVAATFFMMALATAQYTIRVVNHNIPVGEGPSSTEEDLIVAERLRDLGMTPGTKVAVIGDGEGAYWARLARVRIVAEVMDRNGGSVQFWRSAESVQQQVYDLFQSAHAKIVVASCVSSCPPDRRVGRKFRGHPTACITSRRNAFRATTFREELPTLRGCQVKGFHHGGHGGPRGNRRLIKCRSA
jgi:Fe2+ transport system protein FeoA